MDDVQYLLDSEELKSVVAALEALRSKDSKSQAQAKQRFRDLVLGDEFQAADILAILASDQTYYPGLKSVLAAGLAGWLVDPDPKYNSMRFDAMCRAAMEHMDEAERKAGLSKRRWDVGRDIIARYVYTGTDFLGEIYDELGGYGAFQDASSVEVSEIVAHSEHFAINTVLRAMAYFHHGADLWRKGETFPPSLNRAVLILSGLKGDMSDFSEHFVSRSLLHKRWSASKGTLALIYAADSIKVKGSTLFQVIWDQEFSYDKHKKYFNRWMCRARYVSSHIFSCSTDSDLQRITDDILGIGDSERFSPPALALNERALLERHFLKPVVR
ncbi:hypothetical protein AKG11_28355 [Shinella sp. SUS2]|uniref:hypothetical protein n=1 Tax=unclassified Shinella TaxID=2643062 RepID=UPI00067FA2F1|nr:MULTISPECIES: hypothetical protein [unclassified Shinella]KNY13648.1 hypothetical protein AKG11_28355 [Shinella sp. SUS2]KOC72541.1 hypothetical protein AKG10_27220 [Shinella sp. GWS1]